MKTITVILLFTLITQNSWIKDIDALIQTIDLNANEIKSKLITKDDTVSKYSKSKLDKNFRTVICITGKDNFLYEFKVYHSKNKFFLISEFNNFAFYYKGINSTMRPISEIKETKLYFKNDSIGIEYIRSIDVFENQNIDSLKVELLKKPFTSKPLNNIDYIKNKNRLKRMKKIIGLH